MEKEQKYTYAPTARVFFNGVEQSPTLQERIQVLADSGAPSRMIKELANNFGGYVEVKLRPY